MEQSFYDGIKGHRRLKSLEKQIERVSGEFETRYADSPEMVYLVESLQWESPSRLIFLMAQRNVHFAWQGMRDYGFIRLCRKWVEENEVTELTAKAAAAMIRSVLPSGMCDDLAEELAALELF